MYYTFFGLNEEKHGKTKANYSKNTQSSQIEVQGPEIQHPASLKENESWISLW